ncbi:MAG: ABC transporter ATP-binding protein [Oscillospiraceae bacterium]|nr:ABC transporter ATP-binding protein [Oscillospiraceae bacterium]
MKQYKWAFEWMGKYKFRLILAIFFDIAGVGLMTWEPYIFKDIVDDVLMPQQFERLFPMLGLSVAVGLAFSACRYFTSICAEQAAEAAVVRLKGALFRKLMVLGPDYYRENKAGDIINKCSGDVEVISRSLSFVIPRVVEFILMLAVALFVFLRINWKYTLILLLVSPFTAVMANKMGKRLHPAFKKARKQLSNLNAVVAENIAGNRVVKAFVREDFEMEKFQTENQGYKARNIEAVSIWLKYGPIIDSLASVITVINLVVGSILVIIGKENGGITYGELTLFLSFAWTLNEPLMMLGMLVNDIQRFRASTEKVQELYYMDVAIQDPEKDESPETVEGRLDLNHVTLDYGSTRVLDDVSMHIAPGQVIGVMGSTGSGKTTLVNVIDRYVDVTGGSVEIDGVDVRKWSLKKLRSSIGLTMQDVFLFSDTVESNIAYGVPDTEMENILSSAVIADADEFVSQMPDKYDTIVGERGTGLSGGQKQRVSLARAIAKHAPILILDDTTSAVDMETEEYIQKHLAAMPDKCTTIIIAQRISSVKQADYIYILDKGRILEEGTHKQLMQQKGYYYKTCVMQHGLEDAEADAAFGTALQGEGGAF